MGNITFVGISGSLRKASRNTGLLRCCAAHLPQNVSLEIADISALPFYNADIEKPAVVQRLIDQVSAADGLVLACPEYNYSLAPALKNALDWVSRVPNSTALNGKPAAIMGAGGGMGTSRAQYHLRQVCVYLNLHVLNKPELFSNAFTPAFADNGDVQDEGLASQATALMQAMTDWTLRLK